MIVTKKRSLNKITSELKKDDEVGIVSCNSCARFCHTGGEEEMREMARKLGGKGYNVVDQDLIGVACDYDQLKKDELKGSATIVQACDAGVYNLKKLFPNRKIIKALQTIGLAAYNEEGETRIVREFK